MTSSGLWLNEKQHFQTNFMKTRSKHLPGCHPWRNCFFSLCVASIIVIALLATSCKSTEKISNISATDSLTWNRNFSVTLATIPSSLANLTIPMDSLRRLPEGAVYSDRQGQATVTASRKDDNIHVSASCDSLQNVCYRQEEELVRIRDRLREEQIKKEPATITFWQRFKWCSTGVLIGFILTVIIQFIYKIWQKTRKRHP